MRVDPAVRGTRRLLVRDRRDQSVQRMGRSATGLRRWQISSAPTGRRDSEACAAPVSGARAAADRFAPDGHTYLRLSPEMRAQVNGPKSGDEPPDTGTRHPVLKGFERPISCRTAARLSPLRVAAGRACRSHSSRRFRRIRPRHHGCDSPRPIFPAWSYRSGKVTSGLHAGRYRPSICARTFARTTEICLKNVVRWAVGEDIPLQWKGGA